MSDNNNTSRKEDVVAPSMNREDSPNLQSYKSSQQASNRVETYNRCKYCNNAFSSLEKLAAHYRKEHPER
ncbi:MAG: hypothetical protein ACJ71K_11840 [Nitrososphaeraceae archaeon]